MMRTAITIILLVAVSAGGAYAQITVGAGDIDAILGSELEGRISILEEPAQTPEIQALVAADGEADTYDFSGITFEETISGRMTYTAPGPGIPHYDDPHFAQADLVVEMQFQESGVDTSVVMWSFSKIEEDGVYSLGMIMPMDDIDEDGEPDTLAMEFDPPLFSSPLSYTYGDSWTMDPMFGEDDTEVEVTGYGTLIAPDGTARQALRVEHTTSFFGLTMTSIEFVTGGEDGLPGVSASVEVGLDGSVTSVSFTEITGEVGTSTDGVDLPERIALDQNYPNPFNPTTTIPFELEEAGHVAVKVFDTLGREVATLVEGILPAGYHTVSFEAGDLPSGTYIYRLTSGSSEKTQIMTLLK